MGVPGADQPLRGQAEKAPRFCSDGLLDDDFPCDGSQVQYPSFGNPVKVGHRAYGFFQPLGPATVHAFVTEPRRVRRRLDVEERLGGKRHPHRYQFRSTTAPEPRSAQAEARRLDDGVDHTSTDRERRIGTDVEGRVPHCQIINGWTTGQRLGTPDRHGRNITRGTPRPRLPR